jgi:hypothetical protein
MSDNSTHDFSIDGPLATMVVPVAQLPNGTVTLLFSDVDGSTELVKRLGERYGDVLAEHRRLLRGVFTDHGGIEIDTQATPSSSHLAVLDTLSPPPLQRSGGSPRTPAATGWRFASGWVSTHANRIDPARAMSALVSTAQRESARSGMEARCCSHARRSESSTTRRFRVSSCATWANTGSRTSIGQSGSLSSWSRVCLATSRPFGRSISRFARARPRRRTRGGLRPSR